MEIVHVSTRGQIVIPERIREKFNLRKGSRLFLRESGNKLILEEEKAIEKNLQEQEAAGWLVLAEQSLKEVWDNEEDERVWKEYL